MSDTETEPEALEDDAPGMANPPEILVFGMSGGLVGAVINRQVDDEGANIADRAKTQLVMAPTQLDLESRCKSALIAQYGLTQDEADSLIPSAMTPLATMDGGGYVSSAGGEMTGPLMLSEDPAGNVPLQAATKHYVDNIDNMKLNNHGDVMVSGTLTMLQDPVDPMDTATKQYVDAAVAALDARVAALEALVT